MEECHYVLSFLPSENWNWLYNGKYRTQFELTDIDKTISIEPNPWDGRWPWKSLTSLENWFQIKCKTRDIVGLMAYIRNRNSLNGVFKIQANLNNSSNHMMREHPLPYHWLVESDRLIKIIELLWRRQQTNQSYSRGCKHHSVKRLKFENIL